MYLIDVDLYIRATEDVVSNLMDPKTTFIAEANKASAGEQPVILHGTDLDLPKEISSATSQESSINNLACSYLCFKAGDTTSYTSLEEVNLTQGFYLNPFLVVLYMTNYKTHFFKVSFYHFL